MEQQRDLENRSSSDESSEVLNYEISDLPAIEANAIKLGSGQSVKVDKAIGSNIEKIEVRDSIIKVYVSMKVGDNNANLKAAAVALSKISGVKAEEVQPNQTGGDIDYINHENDNHADSEEICAYSFTAYQMFRGGPTGHRCNKSSVDTDLKKVFRAYTQRLALNSEYRVPFRVFLQNNTVKKFEDCNNSHLNNIEFSNGNFSSTSFIYASLIGCDLREAYLYDANFHEALIIGCNIDPIRMAGIKGLDETSSTNINEQPPIQLTTINLEVSDPLELVKKIRRKVERFKVLHSYYLHRTGFFSTDMALEYRALSKDNEVIQFNQLYFTKR